jgi:SPX domain protein involved in polyphosphate accumulation
MFFNQQTISDKEFRYERKYLAEQISTSQVQAIIKSHPAMFVMAYPPRYVNNIYLDTEEMRNYFDNVDGVENRQKVRLRWYGDLFGPIADPILELKVKHGLVGTKFQYPFEAFSLAKGFNKSTYRTALANTHLPPPIHQGARQLNPILVNRYYRWYYATKDGRFRITLDTQLLFHHVAQLNNRFIHHQSIHDNFIVEFKYQAEDELEAQRISRRLPFRVTKSSKYVQGIDRVYF